MNERKIQPWLGLGLVVLAVCTMAGCAAKTVPVWGDSQTGIILRYRLPEGLTLTYDSWGETHQRSDFRGKTIETDISSSNSFTVLSNGQKENNFDLAITIDKMSIKIQTPQAQLEPDMNSVNGKNFDMVLSPLGKEVELIGADAIEYELGPEGPRSIEASFEDIFPNLAGRPLKVGDSWPDETTITEKTGSGEARIHFSGVNTLEGFETVDGMECVKITGKYSGTIEGKGEQQGVELATRGDLEGTTTWYFAYKEGLFVKQRIVGTAEGVVDVPSQGIQIPFTREMDSEISLKK